MAKFPSRVQSQQLAGASSATAKSPGLCPRPGSAKKDCNCAVEELAELGFELSIAQPPCASTPCLLDYGSFRALRSLNSYGVSYKDNPTSSQTTDPGGDALRT